MNNDLISREYLINLAYGIDYPDNGFVDVHAIKHAPAVKNAIELPCMVGDTVYTIYRNKPKAWQVSFIGISADSEVSYIQISYHKDSEHWGTEIIRLNQIGKIVYLTEKSALQALKEREKE